MACTNNMSREADLGEVRWVRTNPLFTDILNLLVLIITPSVFDTQRLRASHLRPIAHIDTATYVEEVIKDRTPYIFGHLCSEKETPMSGTQTLVQTLLYSDSLHEILQ